MITRFAPFALIALLSMPAAAQEAPGDYILLLDEQKRPLAGSYRIGPDVKMTIQGREGGLPRNPVYLDRAFFPTREAEMLAFYNTRHAYSSDPAAIDVGGEMRIVDTETLQPPLFKDQKPEREKALNAVETRFSLPADQVDMLITAGGDALRGNRVFRDFLASVGGRAAPRPPAPQAPHVASVSSGTTGMASR